MMNWEQQRDNNIAKRDLAMEETRLARMESAVKTGRTLDLPQATAAQMELFAVGLIILIMLKNCFQIYHANANGSTSAMCGCVLIAV